MQARAEGRPAVIFDVDGTLVDSNYLHTLAWFRAFRSAGHQIEMYRIHRMIGMGSDQLVKTLVGQESPQLSEAHSEAMKQFRGDQVAFPEAAALLREVSRRGAMVSWATSAKPDEIDRLKQVVGAGDEVEHVTGSGDVESTKPAPDLFSVTIERCGLQPARTIAVGDTKWDIEAAHRSGIGCIGVLTGGSSAPELEEAGALAVYVDVRQLLRELDSSPLGELLRS